MLVVPMEASDFSTIVECLLHFLAQYRRECVERAAQPISGGKRWVRTRVHDATVCSRVHLRLPTGENILVPVFLTEVCQFVDHQLPSDVISKREHPISENSVRSNLQEGSVYFPNMKHL